MWVLLTVLLFEGGLMGDVRMMRFATADDCAQVLQIWAQQPTPLDATNQYAVCLPGDKEAEKDLDGPRIRS